MINYALKLSIFGKILKSKTAYLEHVELTINKQNFPYCLEYHLSVLLEN